MSGTITAGSWRYQITDEDMLWLARVLRYEGGSSTYAATAWTAAQRFAQVHGRYPTFTEFLRAYSQPINPAWLRDGEHCGPGGDYADTDYCAERRLAVRDRAVNDPVPEQLAWVRRWAAGQIPNPVPRAVEWATPAMVQRKVDRGELTVIARLENWYAANAASLRWPADYVRVNGAGPSPSALAFWSSWSPLTIALVATSALAGVAVVGWVAWRTMWRNR